MRPFETCRQPEFVNSKRLVATTGNFTYTLSDGIAGGCYNKVPPNFPFPKKIMSIYALFLLALSMSMDAFAVSVAKGTTRRMTSRRILLTALIFGTVEALTPVAGWLLGSVAKSFINEWDHWLAFLLLGVLGLKMIREGLSGEDAEIPQDEEPRSKNHWLMTAVTAFATSIDSMVVGVGLAFMDVNICIAALTIGTATTVMTAIGLTIGHRLGRVVGKRAEIFGGAVLIAIGTLVLFSHLQA